MQLQFHQPCAALSAVVESFWSMEIDADANSPFIHRCLAHTAPELVFHCHGKFDRLDATDACFSSGVQAQSQTFRRFIATEKTKLFGVRFRPHGLREIFRFDAFEFTGFMPELHHLIGKAAMALEDQIASTGNDDTRIAVLSELLIKKLQKNTSVQKATIASIALLVRHNGNISVQNLASFACLGERQLERVFRQTTGMSPKLFSRITRFRSALNASAQPNSLTQMAIDSGYYDQSHFIREFKTFSGYCPGDFFSGNLGLERFTV